MAKWRLIETPNLSGLENMAIDEALLRCFALGASQPVLRLYGWNPPALSLGRFQKAGEVLDLPRCDTAGVAVVRRITGGGVIYHADELTYAIVCSPQQIPPAASIKDSFRVLTAFLLAMYRRLGLDAGYAVDCADNPARLGERTPFCFAGRETFDIIVNGRKIGGNAQRRLKNVIFQHGSVPLVDRSLDGLGFMIEQLEGFAGSVTSLASEGVALPLEQVRGALIEGWREAISPRLISGVLTEQERAEAERLLAEKYGTRSWNLEGIEHEDRTQA